MSTPLGLEQRTWGPPGCGKTSYVVRKLKGAAERYGADRVIAGSFTRAGALEIASRDTPLHFDQVATVHRLCLQALGRPELVGSHIAAWNEQHTAWRLTSYGRNTVEVDGPSEKLSLGDELLDQIGLLRCKLIPRERWPHRVWAFWEAWSNWKAENDYLDFTDLLEICLKDHIPLPGNPRVAIWDEAQDFDPLMFALCRQWSKDTDYTIFVGDDDQCLYRFKGSDPEAFLRPELPPEQNFVLDQSYRVPAAVQRFAERITGQLSFRYPKTYKPRDAEGSVSLLRCNWRAPERLVEALEQRIGEGGTCMVLAAAGFMLTPLLHQMRQKGIRFHNPWAVTRGDWNPIRLGSEKQTTALDRVLAFLRQDPELHGDHAAPWTWKNLNAWLEPMKAAGVFKRGFKKWASTQPPHKEVEPWDLDPWAGPDVLERLWDGSLEWYRGSLLTSKARTYEPIFAAAARSKKSLLQRPRVSVGSIHSVKGAEADHVFLIPDVSAAGWQEWCRHGPDKDSVLRLFYVGATRARTSLTLLQAAGKKAFPWPSIK